MVAPHHTLLEVLTRFAETLTDEFDVADVLDELADSTVAVIGATAAGVSLTDDGGALQFVSANTEPAAELERVQQASKEGPATKPSSPVSRSSWTTSSNTRSGRHTEARPSNRISGPYSASR